MAVVSGNGGREAGKYCCLCGAWFNNPLMAQQHYEGKKHRRNAARARLLEQLAGSLDATESTGQPLSRKPTRVSSDGWQQVLGPCVRKDDMGEIIFKTCSSEGAGWKYSCILESGVHFTDTEASQTGNSQIKLAASTSYCIHIHQTWTQTGTEYLSPASLKPMDVSLHPLAY